MTGIEPAWFGWSRGVNPSPLAMWKHILALLQ